MHENTIFIIEIRADMYGKGSNSQLELSRESHIKRYIGKNCSKI